jgi:ArsR family transcriptional regulator
VAKPSSPTIRGPRGKLPAPSANGTAAGYVIPDRALRELTDIFKSLADQNRLKILMMLARDGEMNVSSIGKELGQSQPAVSHHLTQLRTAGLVDFRRDGKFNFYALDAEKLGNLIDQFFPNATQALQRLTFGELEVNFKRK